jgi:hypothetical protein
VLLGDRSKSGNFSGACVGEQNVDLAFLLLHGGVQSVEIGQLRDVTLDAGDILADLPGREVELALTAAGDEDVSLLGGESLGGGEANTTVPPVMTATLPSSFAIVWTSLGGY